VANAQSPSSGEAVLSVDAVRVAYGGLTVLDDLSFAVVPGEMLGLVGPNGAGKSTAINVVAGVVKHRSGAVRFDGHLIDGLSPARRSRRGIARTFQNLELFPTMTVYQNVLCAAEGSAERSGPMLKRSVRAQLRLDVAEALSLLRLDNVAATTVHTLPYGTKKLVELARVFVRRPRFVLLDEPVAGLNRDEKAEFAVLFSRLHKRFGLSGVLVEHDMPTVQSICSRVAVLDAGHLLAEGPVTETLRRPEVVTAYLGPLTLRDPA
jgi:ABC-type branched-subunit amino acid transport system ATPase component